jgi:hypothetical protein
MKYPFMSKINDGIFIDRKTVKSLRFTTFLIKEIFDYKMHSSQISFEMHIHIFPPNWLAFRISIIDV